VLLGVVTRPSNGSHGVQVVAGSSRRPDWVKIKPCSGDFCCGAFSSPAPDIVSCCERSYHDEISRTTGCSLITGSVGRRRVVLHPAEPPQDPPAR